MGLELSIGPVVLVHIVKLEAIEYLMVVEIRPFTRPIQLITFVFTT
ncbi:hypothetical protein M3Y94_00667600 [Aphelenchoides besseyi]|nr:hypothetical protein M3Y94_00667600 [Aphelenchoides besseyi]